MTGREFLHMGVTVLSAAGGVLLVALIVGGVVGSALAYGAALCAIAGVVCLALGALARP